jgi:hypothetical protein
VPVICAVALALARSTHSLPNLGPFWLALSSTFFHVSQVGFKDFFIADQLISLVRSHFLLLSGLACCFLGVLLSVGARLSFSCSRGW